MGWIGGIVEPPNGRDATFTIFDQGRAERVIVISFQHLFSFGEGVWATIRSKSAGLLERGLGDCLSVVVIRWL